MKWSKENCLNEAKKFKTRSEWNKNSSSSYLSAIKHGWLEECSNHMIKLRNRNNFWTKEECFKEAKKYKTRSEWQLNSKTSYITALKNKWLEEFIKDLYNEFINRTQPTYDYSKIIEIDFTKNIILFCEIHGYFEVNPLAHLKLGLGCLKCSINKPNGYWTKEKCVEDALRYATRSEWQKYSKSAYSIAYSKGWLDECTKHMNLIKKPNNYWTLNRCIVDALKYKTRSEWSKNSNSAYTTARKNNWMEECCKHMNK